GAIRYYEHEFSVMQMTPGRENIADEAIRLNLAYWDRANLLQELGEADAAGPDMQAALILDPEIAKHALPLAQRDLSAWSSLLDLLSWNDRILGSRLRQPRARLIVLQSDAELAATHNIEFLEAIQELTAE